MASPFFTVSEKMIVTYWFLWESCNVVKNIQNPSNQWNWRQQKIRHMLLPLKGKTVPLKKNYFKSFIYCRNYYISIIYYELYWEKIPASTGICSSKFYLFMWVIWQQKKSRWIHTLCARNGKNNLRRLYQVLIRNIPVSGSFT